MVYENYEERRGIWINYFSTNYFQNPYEENHRENPESWVMEILTEERADIDLAREKLINAETLKEKNLLKLIIEEFESPL